MLSIGEISEGSSACHFGLVRWERDSVETKLRTTQVLSECTDMTVMTLAIFEFPKSIPRESACSTCGSCPCVYKERGRFVMAENA